MIGSRREMAGVLSRDEAFAMAEDEAWTWSKSSRTDLPVCKDHGLCKFKFEMQKKANEAKKKTKQQEIKELKFRPVTDDGRLPDQVAQHAPLLRGATR